jgi:hypothetical protein
MQYNDVVDIMKIKVVHLTSHRTSDSPCICQYVYWFLKKHGFDTDKMNYQEITMQYQKLQRFYPHYPYLYVI